jgi:RNA polymerase sigma-70 factor (family 1)
MAWMGVLPTRCVYDYVTSPPGSDSALLALHPMESLYASGACPDGLLTISPSPNCRGKVRPGRTELLDVSRSREACVTMVDPESHPGGSWVERIRSDDDAAFEAMYRSAYPGLCSLVARRIGSRETAEELVQEVFLSVWTCRSTLDPTQSIMGYLYQCARNQASSYLRHRGFIRRSMELIRPSLPLAAASADEEWRYAEIARLADEAIEGLPDRCREVFLLRRRAGRSYAEIAELLEISPKTVENQMGKALKALRSTLAPYL